MGNLAGYAGLGTLTELHRQLTETVTVLIKSTYATHIPNFFKTAITYGLSTGFVCRISAPMILISPTEPPSLRSIGTTSLTPESFGADILILQPHGNAAIQRKTLSDLYASIIDGRIDKQVNQLLAHSPTFEPILIIENCQWTSSYQSLEVPNFPYSTFLHYTHSIHRAGILLLSTFSITHTIETVRSLDSYYQKSAHNEFNALQSHAITPGSILQYIPGIGPKLAHAIIAHANKVPLAWTIDRDTLLEVPGIGPKLADRILSCFDSQSA